MRPFYFILIIALGTQSLFSQKKEITKATKAYKQLAYINTAEVLEKVAEKGYASSDLYEKIGNAYYFNRNMEDAAIWYEKLMKLNSADTDPELYFRYAQALKTLQNNEASEYWMNKFLDTNPNDSRTSKLKQGVGYYDHLNQKNPKYKNFTNVPFNSDFSDFGSTLFNNQLIFASARKEGPLYPWNNQPYLDLFSVDDHQSKNPRVENDSWFSSFNTPFHESSLAYSPDQETVYFTRNNYHQGFSIKGKNDINRLQLYQSEKEANGDWSTPKLLPFSDVDYSTAHPTLSSDGSLMVFSSDMPGSEGLADLYIVPINEDGTFGQTQNLGSEINTETTESFPFLNENGDLFFSSDGYPGEGSLDVYVIRDFLKLYQSNEISFDAIQHLDKPVNSPFDDFAYMEYQNGEKGYLSSNRAEGKGDDDIYSFEIIDKCIIQGFVSDSKTSEKIPFADVTLMTQTGEPIGTAKADANAAYSFEAECVDNYLIRAEKEQYELGEIRWDDGTVDQLAEIKLKPIKTLYGVGDDIADALEIKDIYFDIDKHNIRYDAEIDLEKVLVVLEKYPNMKISIRSHTDCRGSKSYNEKLSHRRAISTMNYLTDKGIEPSRLTAKGFGESQLKVECGTCNSCSEEQHQSNRRSEFIIVSME